MQAASHQEAAALLQQGIDALRSGDKQSARSYLAQTLRLDPQNDQAWLWLSGVVVDDDQRRECLERALAINPQNEAARQGLAYLAPEANQQPAPESVPESPAEIVQPAETTSSAAARSAAVETAGVPAALAIEQLRSTRRTRSPVLPILIGVCILVLVVFVLLLVLRLI